MSFTQLPHHPPQAPAPAVATPVAAAVARTATAVQAAAGVAVAGWFGYCAASVKVTANAEDYSELWQLICAAGCVLATTMTLLVAVPALLLRRGNTGAWWTLLVMEFVCAAPVVLALPTLGGHSPAPYTVGTAVFALAGTVAVAALLRTDVRTWSRS